MSNLHLPGPPSWFETPRFARLLTMRADLEQGFLKPLYGKIHRPHPEEAAKPPSRRACPGLNPGMAAGEGAS
jgi:hypothetical protein